MGRSLRNPEVLNLQISLLNKRNLTELVEDGPLSYDIAEHKGKKTAVNVKRLDEQAKK